MTYRRLTKDATRMKASSSPLENDDIKVTNSRESYRRSIFVFEDEGNFFVKSKIANFGLYVDRELVEKLKLRFLVRNFVFQVCSKGNRKEIEARRRRNGRILFEGMVHCFRKHKACSVPSGNN